MLVLSDLIAYTIVTVVISSPIALHSDLFSPEFVACSSTVLQLPVANAGA